MSLTLSKTPDTPEPINAFGWQHCLDDILDARLIADRRVVDFHRNHPKDSILFSAGAPPGSTARTVRTTHRILTVVAIPGGMAEATILRRNLHNRPDLHDLLLLSERYLRRRPHIDGAVLVAECAGTPVSPLARVLLWEHLSEFGGSSVLGDCTACMHGARDPVQAILSLAATKTIAVDISRPITAQTLVYLPVR